MVTISRRTFLASLVGTLAAPLVADAQQAGSSGWWSGPEELGPGVSFSVIDGIPGGRQASYIRHAGSYTVHVRYPAGHTVGPHRHKSEEHVTVLSGRLLIGWGDVWDPTKLEEVPVGKHIEVPAGVVHFTAVREETVMEVTITGVYDVEYVLDADDPREAKR